jgi:hypothetical protein
MRMTAIVYSIEFFYLLESFITNDITAIIVPTNPKKKAAADNHNLVIV